MVVTKIVCDTPLCRHKGRSVSGEGETRAQVRRRARKQGWLCVKGHDLCPECKAGVTTRYVAGACS